MRTVHHGINIKRFRSFKDLSQEKLALRLGGDWNQTKISELEKKEVIEDNLLEQIAPLISTTSETLKHLEWEALGDQNNFNSSPNSDYHNHQNNQNTFYYGIKSEDFFKGMEPLFLVIHELITFLRQQQEQSKNTAA